VLEVTDYDNEIIREMGEVRGKVEHALENYRFREALQEAMNLARIGNKYLTEAEPWKLFKTEPSRVATILNISLQITAGLTIILEPFLPFSSEKLRKMLNTERLCWEKAGLTDLLPIGHKINEPELLFEKIEDSVIEAQINRLKNIKTQNQVQNATVAEQLPSVTFDDFTKMDIRVGKILQAEKVAKTKKLMKLLIDTGVDQRTVVSGIAEYFEPEDVIGKQVSILINLEPLEIRGIQSQGMILMAENADGRLTFVSPQTEVKNGSTIK
jgi:methionyl-tRNA synthetase